MDDYTYVKALLIRYYSELLYLSKNDVEFATVDEEWNEWIIDILNAIDAMSSIILIEKGYTLNPFMRFSFTNGIPAVSALEILTDEEGVAPVFIQNAINEILELYHWINTFGYDSDYDPEESFQNVLKLYDSICIWFWGNTELRKHLNDKEASTIRQVFSFITPHIQEIDKCVEKALKESIIAGENREKEADENQLRKQIVLLTNEVKKLRGDFVKLDEKIDVLGDMIKEMSGAISVNQAFISRLLDRANNEEEIEKLIASFSDEITEKVSNSLSKKYDQEIFEDELSTLEDIFGDSWKKLSEDSKKFIVTAKIIYKKQWKLGNLMDYSGVCVLITKALELEMSKRFYSMFLKYMTGKYGENDLSVYPTSLVSRYKDNSLCEPKDYTLGSVAYTLCYKKVKDKKLCFNNEQKLVEFCRNELMTGKDKKEILSVLRGYGEKIERIRNDYRNPCAHTNALQAINAKECMDLVVDVEKLLKVMLDSFDK